MMETLGKGMMKIAAALVAVFVFGVFFIPNWENNINHLTKKQILGQSQTKDSEIAAAPELAAMADKPELTAKSVLAYDFKSGSILYSYNFDEQLPVASLTKLLSALVIVDSGKLQTLVTITEPDTLVIGANTGLVVGEQILVSELMKSMLIASHNDATLALARHVGGTIPNFVEMMNKKATELGMNNTHFTDPIGLDFINHYSTAHDLSFLLEKFLANEYLSNLVKTKETEILSKNLNFTHKVKTTNKLLLEDASIVGVKTGYTNEAKGNLVIRSVRNDADVVTIVLGSDDREGDTRKVLDWIYTVYKW